MRVLRLLMVVSAVSVLTRGPALAQTPPPPASRRRRRRQARSRRATRPPHRRRRRPRAAAAAAVPRGREGRLRRHSGASRRTRSRARRPAARSRSSQKKKVAEIAEKNKQLEAAETKLQTSGRHHERLGAAVAREGNRQADARGPVRCSRKRSRSGRRCQAELQVDFQRKLIRCSSRSRKEKGLHMLVEHRQLRRRLGRHRPRPAAEVIKRLDAASQPAPSRSTSVRGSGSGVQVRGSRRPERTEPEP